MKKIYVAPSILLVALGDDLMDVITPASQAGDVFPRRKEVSSMSRQRMKIIQQKQAPFGMSRCGNKSLHC